MTYVYAPLLFGVIIAAAVVVARGRNSRQDRFWDRDLND